MSDAGHYDDDIDGLYAGPLGDFIAARNALAARAKKAGAAQVAVLVKALPKPSAAAWAVNQLWRKRRDAFESLFDAGAELRAAHGAALGKGVLPRGKDPASALRDAQRSERDAITLLVGGAGELLAEAGQSVAQATLDRVATTLDALATRGVWPGPPGRLDRELDPPGLDALIATEPGERRPAKGTPPPGTETATRSSLPSAEEAKAAKKIADAQVALRRATEVERRARRELDDAEAARERTADRAKMLVREAEDAERKASRAREAAIEAGDATARAAERTESAAATWAKADAERIAAETELARLRKA